jgi:RNA polymerase sigma-70 factor (ECF subfamily)
MMSSNTGDFSERIRQCTLHMTESGVAALSGLFDLTSLRLVRLAITITHNQHDAEDAVQAALVRVAAEPRLLSKAEQPWHYLLRMVRNEALMILRRKRFALSLTSIADLMTERSVDQVEQEEQFRAVWKALRKLPVEQSEVVVLKIWEELTFWQIGQVLDITPATAASRYRYALDKLARKLRPSIARDQLGHGHKVAKNAGPNVEARS